MKQKKLCHSSRTEVFKFWLLFRTVSVFSIRTSLDEKNKRLLG